jgi:hypothetical protein
MFLKRPQRVLLMLIFSALKMTVSGQTTLPNFQVIQRNGVNIISWNNEIKEITQLIIQRSVDSLTGFRSIVSMPDPTSLTNGFVDRKSGSKLFFYRIFYVMPGGRYVFTESQKPKVEIPPPVIQPTIKKQPTPNPAPVIVTTDPPITKKEVQVIIKKQPDTAVSRLSLVYQKIGLSQYNWRTITILPRTENRLNDDTFVLSSLIYTNGEGNLIISLPDAPKNRFTLRVFREDKSLLFEMKHIRENQLLIDRSNFHNSGWFRYELREGERIREKNRFYIKPDGK